MIAAVSSGRPSGPAGPAPPAQRNLFVEGFGLMRERWPIYLAFSILCGIAGLTGTMLTEQPDLMFTLPSVRVAAGLSLVALFFVLPTAVRKIQPSFRMTPWRLFVTICMFAIVGFLVDVGYTLAFFPGVVVGILLSQAILIAVMNTGESPAASGLRETIATGFQQSYELTRNRFGTTLGVVTLSLVILAVPVLFMFLTLVIVATWIERSQVVFGPALFLTFVYFECVRYTMIVRWYRKLRTLGPPADAWPPPAAPIPKS